MKKTIEICCLTQNSKLRILNLLFIAKDHPHPDQDDNAGPKKIPLNRRQHAHVGQKPIHTQKNNHRTASPIFVHKKNKGEGEIRETRQLNLKL